MATLGMAGPTMLKKVTGSLAAILSTATLLFTGCMMGPDYKKPDLTTPETFRFAATVEVSQEKLNLRWWELFDDPVLISLVETALENNLEVRLAISRINQARAAMGFTDADLYPRLDIDGGVQVGNYFGGARSDSTDYNAFIAPVLSWEIDFWGRFRRASESAQASLLASEYSLRTIQLGLVTDVISTYYLLLDYHQRLEISKYTLTSRLESLDIIDQRFEKGIVPELDLNQAQIQKEIAAAAIPLYERLIAKTENVLSLLLGEYPHQIRTGASLHDQGVPPTIPVGLPSIILERRPDIAESLALLHSQTAAIGVAEAQRFPSISLTGLLGVASAELGGVTADGEIWNIGAGLTGPIFDWNKNKYRVNVEEEKARQAMLNYEGRLLLAYREVADALNEISTYQYQLHAVERKYTAAKNANDLSKLRYDRGVTSYLEVLETERTLFAVGLELSELKQQYLSAYVKLYKALGGGWLTEGQEAATAAENNQSSVTAVTASP